MIEIAVLDAALRRTSSARGGLPQSFVPAYFARVCDVTAPIW
jgi:hypothetical protein